MITQSIKKHFCLQEKNLIYAPLTDNILIMVRQSGKFGQTGGKIVT